MFSYTDGGRREPFDPVRLVRATTCLLCDRPAAAVGVFVPQTAAALRTVLRLRRQPTRPRSTASLAYVLCRHHAANLDTTAPQVEAAIERAADAAVLQ